MIPISDDFTVVVDTCVLAHGFLRDLLFNLAEAGVFSLRLSDDILEELKRTLKGSDFKWNPSFKRPTHEQKRTKWMSIQMKTATQRGKRDHHG
jgi:predicted nucleic acid-binding protein